MNTSNFGNEIEPVDGNVLLYAIVDEVGIDFDRFRLRQNATMEKLYLTGIEFAVAAAGWIAVRFLRGYIRGLRAAAREAGIEPDKVGERLGRVTGLTIATHIKQLEERAAKLLASEPQEVRQQSAAMGAEIGRTLREIDSIEAELPEQARELGQSEGRHQVASDLMANGFDSTRAEQIAENLATFVRDASDNMGEN